ncbi:MAG: glycosyltransferase family 4 protein [Bacteroidota bacterium]|nr:glycosyltransferase family 4 protein [Bacteroidota bacterium]
MQQIKQSTIQPIHLHIVCLDVPYPPDYGGVFDLFYKIKALHQLGVKIHLHCFEYGRGEQPELNQYCEEVNYYKRNKSLKGILSRLPYIVSSRISSQLIKNILKDNYPVLLEGIHCTYCLYNGDFKNRKVLVRLHNVEFEYYHQLALSTKHLFKKNWFAIESKLLKSYENKIAEKAKFVTVNEKDKLTYENIFSAKDINFLPVFLPFDEVGSLTGKGTFCLYHGNLSVAENEKAIVWLLENVFNDSEIDFTIAGKNPTKFLRNQVSKNKKARLVENPSDGKMRELIKNAHIHLLPSFNTTGIKIKLLNALFNGRFIITNAASIDGTGLETLCKIAEDSIDYKNTIRQLMQVSFEQEEINKRNEILKREYDNNKNATQLMKWL